jgi:hypothetical protein
VEAGKARIVGITLRLAAVTVIAAAIALGLTLGATKPVAPAVTIAAKTDREPAAVHLVRTIPIPAAMIQLPPGPSPSVTPISPAVVAVPVAVSGPAPAPPANICERHHGYRVVYRRGTYIGWRCEFPKGKP